MTPTIDIETAVLSKGAHDGPAKGMCVMELTSYIAREPWSDHPACVSPVLASFLRSWNDSLDDDTRQKLKPYCSRVIGTANDGKDEQRAWMCADWLARTQLPVWLDLAGLTEHAAAVRAIIAISDPTSARTAQPILNAASAAAWAAARDAAWDTAWDAASAAASAAARDAASAAAWAAARDTAWDTARDTAWDTASAAAWAAASAAWAAARDAAAWDTASAALQQSVIALQASAFELLDRMLEL